MKEIAQEWLKSAYDDLEVIDTIFSRPELTNMVAFHAQQAIEKALKAYIEQKGIYLPKTHDLLRLIEIGEYLIPDNFYKTLTILNEMYINSRYPGEMGLLPFGKPSINEAINFKKTARKIYDDIKKNIQ